MYWKERSNSSRLTGILLGLAIVGVLLLGGYSVVYADKIYPGVRVDGLYVGGLSRTAALQQIQAHARQYAGNEIAINYNNTTLRLPVNALGLTYTDQAVDGAMQFGRQGSVAQRLRNRLRSLVGGDTSYASFTYNDDRLADVLGQIDGDVTKPVANAQLTFSSGAIAITPSQPGYRFDRGIMVLALKERLSVMDTKTLTVPVSTVDPSITTNSLSAAKQKAEEFIAAPLTLTADSKKRTVNESTILSWIDVTTPAGRSELPVDPLKNFYPTVTVPTINLSLNKTKVGVYVANLATDINQPAKNAVVAMNNGALSITQSSQSGLTLDQAQATQRIIDSLTSATSNRDLKLATASKPADVNENNLDSLGIKDQLSEGVTYFPGSSQDRMTNVRVGGARYNGVLLAPGETFSFGKILGDVGPAQGYVPELVILGNHEEKQYGGGLCQVASTAYRAALLAGLPIVERHNHSFAVSYYTAPYGVPGLDATIYYPQVDFKFKNDTGHYMLIQTKMVGTTLTFDYYGTKTKYGEIRGPQFISGTTDATQPSHTVFWRDIKNADGSLVKTDQVDTYYQPSTDFPIQKQYN